MRCGKADWRDQNPVNQAAMQLHGAEIGIYELALALRNERSNSASLQSNCDTWRNRCIQLEAKVSEGESSLQATVAKLRIVEQQCLQFQGEAQAMQLAAANIAELKLALQCEQAAVASTSAENQQLKCAQEQLKGEMKELEVRLEKQQKDHHIEIKQLCKEHESNVAHELKQIKAMLNLMNPHDV